LSLLPSARTTRDTYTLNCASPALLLPPFPPRHLPPLHKVARKQCLKQVGLQGVPKIAPRISNLLHYIQQVAAPCSGTHDEVCYSSKHESESWYCLNLFSTCMSVCLSVCVNKPKSGSELRRIVAWTITQVVVSILIGVCDMVYLRLVQYER